MSSSSYGDSFVVNDHDEEYDEGEDSFSSSSSGKDSSSSSSTESSSSSSDEEDYVQTVDSKGFAVLHKRGEYVPKIAGAPKTKLAKYDADMDVTSVRREERFLLKNARSTYNREFADIDEHYNDELLKLALTNATTVKEFMDAPSISIPFGQPIRNVIQTAGYESDNGERCKDILYDILYYPNDVTFERTRHRKDICDLCGCKREISYTFTLLKDDEDEYLAGSTCVRLAFALQNFGCEVEKQLDNNHKQVDARNLERLLYKITSAKNR